MPRYKSLPKTKAKKTDEFVSAVDHAVRFLGQYKKVVFLAIVAGLLGGLGYLMVGQKKEGNLSRLNALFFQAGEAKESQEEKYREIYKGYGRYPLASTARIFLVDQYLKRGKNDEALGELTSASESGFSLLAPLLRFSRAELLWQMGKAEEALKYLDEAEGQSGDMGGEIQFLKGRILQSQGKKEEARNVYLQILDLTADDPFLRKEVEGQLVLLNLSS
ncbi:MAG: tetratricopeptide repeat protein [Deltaproteobacteria bacterium]|nr:tetratricopeptide repeat protein [Deltaproteobacteria bacterium]